MSRLLSHQRRLRSAIGDSTAGKHRSRSSGPGWHRGWARSMPGFTSSRRGHSSSEGADRGGGQAPRGHLAGMEDRPELTGKPGDRAMPKSDNSVDRAGTRRGGSGLGHQASVGRLEMEPADADVRGRCRSSTMLSPASAMTPAMRNPEIATGEERHGSPHRSLRRRSPTHHARHGPIEG